MTTQCSVLLAFVVLFCLTTCLKTIELPNECGTTNSLSTSNLLKGEQIVGGEVSSQDQWPWQVFLNKTLTYDGFVTQSDCGAAIISKDWILTAAHCVCDTDDDSSGIKVELEAICGNTDLTNFMSSTEVRRKIVKIVRHEKFDYSTKANDIALLKLNVSLNFDGAEHHLAPICVPKPSEESFQTCSVAGFGYQDAQLIENDYQLHSLNETLQSDSKCQNQFIYYNATYNLCIGGIANKGTCKGDSGSPYMCYHQADSRWYQTGLVSYGIPCAHENIPDVFTRVSYYYNWIVNQPN